MTQRTHEASAVTERWLAAVLATPGLTAIRDPPTARKMLLDDALKGLELVSCEVGPIVDIGSGGGTPGIPLAASLPRRDVTLLEAERRKCDFLARWTEELPNLRVVWGRAEEQPVEGYGVAVAKALARPPVAAEWCLPLVREGGAALIWIGASAEVAPVELAASHLAAAVERVVDGIVVLRKVGPTPAGFPRRPGVAKKRPLA